MSTLQQTTPCQRCKLEEAPALPAAPWPGAQGQEIAAKVCRSCFQDWQAQQTKVINELHLNLGSEEHAALLDAHMMVFFGLLEASEAGIEALTLEAADTPPTQPKP